MDWKFSPPVTLKIFPINWYMVSSSGAVMAFEIFYPKKKKIENNLRHSHFNTFLDPHPTKHNILPVTLSLTLQNVRTFCKLTTWAPQLKFKRRNWDTRLFMGNCFDTAHPTWPYYAQSFDNELFLLGII